MRIHYTYKGDGWVDGTVIIDGLKEYYAGSRKCMRRLPVTTHRYLLDALTRIKPYAHLPHIQL